MVILALKSLEIGQPASAASAAFWNASAEAPGTLPDTARCDSVTDHPESTRSSVTVAVVCNVSATTFDFPSSAESAIVKQAACAAAMSSSGLVPFPLSNRVVNE